MTLTLPRLLLATRNQGKLRELRALLHDLNIKVLSLDEAQNVPPDVEETGQTFADNAALKAVTYGLAARMPTLADDSGLEVDALDGAPGVYSARFAGPQATDADNNTLLLQKLAHTPNPGRTARFRCVLALYIPDETMADDLAREARRLPDVKALPLASLSALPTPLRKQPGSVFTVQGHCEGRILQAPRGEGGFGYDPLFFHEGLGLSFGEAKDEKKTVSHRSMALRGLVTLLRGKS